MVSAIRTRELISVAAGEMCLRGTYHKPQGRAADSTSRMSGVIRTGILFLNSGGDPRTASGGVAVYWADAFAKCGYPSFRFDLAGLGDSEGDLPEAWTEFRERVNSGYYARFISEIAKNLTERYELAGIVVVGHCAGSVSAVYGAAASRHVKGIVALDPYFFCEEQERAAIRKGISDLVTRNWAVAQVSKLYRGVKKARLLVEGNRLPGNANLPFLRSWIRLASSGTPMLVLNTRRAAPRPGEFDYYRYLQSMSSGSNRISVQLLEGANHSFADDLGKTGVRQNIERWLNTHFPLLPRNESRLDGQLAVHHQL